MSERGEGDKEGMGEEKKRRREIQMKTLYPGYN